MVERIQVKPELIRWARERLGRDVDDFGARFKRLAAWESGEAQPTFRQLKDYAQATHVPLGYFFLPEPPIERLPMTDLRTLDNQWLSRPSPNLLDTIYVMQRRQDWLREEMIACEAEPLDFVGSAAISDSPLGVGREMRRIIGFEEGWAAMVNTWQEAVSILRLAMEKIGVIAFINGVVGNNTKRTLNVEEFRGFALCDEYAPLIFVNGADSKSAQMFTLAHELAHIWLGESALSDVHLGVYPTQDIEIWCNKAAAEFLVPENELRECWQSVKHEGSPFDSLARRFKVSPIVAGRRAMELRLVDRATFFDFYRDYIKREKRHRAGSKGGNFYNTQSIRLGEHFPLTVFYAAKEGRVSFKEAYDLTGLHAGAFQEYAYRLGGNAAMSKTISYILDSDVLITAKNSYYTFAICPGFWDSLLHFHELKKIGSIDHVRSELLRGRKTDDLVQWVDNELSAAFFKDTGSEQTANAFGEIMLWVQRSSQYFDHAKAKFAAAADGWLVAYAMVHDAAVVTNEQSQPNSRSRVLLPDICDQFKVTRKNTFEMLHELAIRYEWKGAE